MLVIEAAVMPIIAQMKITNYIHPIPLWANISAKAVSPSPEQAAKFPTPLTANDIVAYISIDINTDNCIALGTSLYGFLASSAMVVMKSKPRYPKNKIVEPSITPEKPSSSFKNGLKCFISKFANETRAINANIASLPEVTILLKISANEEP